MNVESAFAQLASTRRLDRESAVEQLRRGLAALTPEEQDAVHERTLALVRDETNWEPRHGGLLAAALLVATFDREPFRQALIDCVPSLLEDDEQRVRLGCAELLEAIARRAGAGPFLALREYLLASAEQNFEREGARYEGCEEDAQQGYDSEVERADARFRSGAGEAAGTRPPSPRPASPRSPRSPRGPPRKKATSLVIESEGWRALEAAMRAIEGLLRGAGPALAAHLAPPAGGPLLEALGRACGHGSRFVRQIGFDTCEALFGACDEPALARVTPLLAPRVAAGLADNWSAVRLAAARAARALALRWGPPAGSPPAAPEALAASPAAAVLPGLCLNRYYAAEGARLYAAETWRLVVGDGGRALVAALLPEVAALYEGQLRAANYFAREAACHCCGELAAKLEPDRLRPLVPRLLAALRAACGDDSWPVRSAAGLAVSRFAAAFPGEIAPHAEALFAFWEEHLAEALPSIREDAAVAMAGAARALGPAAVARVLAHLAAALPRAREQPPDRGGEAGGRAGPGGQRVFDVAEAVGLPGYTSYVEHRTRRPPEPWEVSDGAVYLLREMAGVAPQEAAALLPALADLPALSHAAAHARLAETVWRQLPATARALGARRLKPHLELLLPPLLRPLARPGLQPDGLRAAAEGCLRELAALVGPSILRGRLAALGPEHAAALDRLPPAGAGPAGPRLAPPFPPSAAGVAPPRPAM